MVASEGYRQGTNWVLGNLVNFDYPVITEQPQDEDGVRGPHIFFRVQAPAPSRSPTSGNSMERTFRRPRVIIGSS